MGDVFLRSAGRTSKRAQGLRLRFCAGGAAQYHFCRDRRRELKQSIDLSLYFTQSRPLFTQGRKRG
jgi:hypothetical protein